MSNDKSRLPDYHVSVVQPGPKGKERFFEIGQLWAGKDGYMTGESVLGRIVVTSREKREELEKMRREKQIDAEAERDAPDGLSQNP